MQTNGLRVVINQVEEHDSLVTRVHGSGRIIDGDTHLRCHARAGDSGNIVAGGNTHADTRRNQSALTGGEKHILVDADIEAGICGVSTSRNVLLVTHHVNDDGFRIGSLGDPHDPDLCADHEHEGHGNECRYE